MSRDPTNEEIEVFAAKLGIDLSTRPQLDYTGVCFDVAFRRKATEDGECYRCCCAIKAGEEVVRSFFRDGRVAHRPCHFTSRKQISEFMRRKRYVHPKAPEPVDPAQVPLFPKDEP